MKRQHPMRGFILGGSKQAAVASVLVLAVMLGCFSAKCDGEITANEYAIYHRLIEHFDLATRSVVITSGTGVDADKELLRDDVLRQLKREFPSVSSDAILTFKSKNARSWPLGKKEQFPASYVLAAC